MKLRSIGSAYRTRALVPLPITPTKEDLESEARRAPGPDIAQYVEYWRRPAALMEKATTASKHVVGQLIKVGALGESSIDDVAQDIVAEFYATKEEDRPNTETAWEIWAFRAARRHAYIHRKQRRREISENVTMEDGSELSLLDRLEHSPRSKPMQLLRCEVMDVAKMIDLLPDDQRTMVLAIARSEDVIGYAEDHNVSVFDAMGVLKRARVIMNRLAEDLADERKFGSGP